VGGALRGEVDSSSASVGGALRGEVDSSSASAGGAFGGEVDFSWGSAEDEDCIEVDEVCFEGMVSPEVADSCGEAGWYILASGKGKLCSARKCYLTVDGTAVEGMSVRTRDVVAPAAFGSGFVRVLLSRGLFLRELHLSTVVSAERELQEFVIQQGVSMTIRLAFNMEAWPSGSEWFLQKQRRSSPMWKKVEAWLVIKV
jgi:hypothetical protein